LIELRHKGLHSFNLPISGFVRKHKVYFSNCCFSSVFKKR